MDYTTKEEVLAALNAAGGKSVVRRKAPIDLFDKRVQLRDPATRRPVERYAEALTNGEVFKPVAVYLDPGTLGFWLSDGNSRLEAAGEAGLTTFDVEFRLGDHRAAMLAAAEANTRHGLSASLDDRRSAGRALLRDAEWATWSNRHLGRIVGLAPQSIERLREAMEQEARTQGREVVKAGKRKCRRGGKTYEAKVPAKAKAADPVEKTVRGLVARVRRAADAWGPQDRAALLSALTDTLVAGAKYPIPASPSLERIFL